MHSDLTPNDGTYSGYYPYKEMYKEVWYEDKSKQYPQTYIEKVLAQLEPRSPSTANVTSRSLTDGIYEDKNKCSAYNQILV